MKPAALHSTFVLFLLSFWLSSCRSDPTLSVTSSLPKQGLRGRTLAVGGLTAPGVNVYPGQTEESIILMNAEEEMQRRLRRSRVLSMAAVQQAVGSAPTRFSSGVPIVLGSKLSPGFIRKVQARGIDYLLWIDLRDNFVEQDSRQNSFIKTASSSCCCGKVNGKTCRTGACASGCGSSCRSSSRVVENVLSAVARRTVAASYSLLDTATGHVTWQAESMLTKSSIHSNSSTTGTPLMPVMPLPPTESEIMKRMTSAALKKLPQ
ncbi:hypothetical protein [Prosthecobacter vanneervenii]|uniref:Uncharacterized protein n=1 Tax=Prosthecobacter vanneervenii TaxID=48466 RepID=A0A7W8DHY5_9BACT|nr:hypothetical protein [Prosthecobacter vanneervenii]MBB5030589.1 hypothetical protein [Prosthecobacter vanneervenii]